MPRAATAMEGGRRSERLTSSTSFNICVCRGIDIRRRRQALSIVAPSRRLWRWRMAARQPYKACANQCLKGAARARRARRSALKQSNASISLFTYIQHDNMAYAGIDAARRKARCSAAAHKRSAAGEEAAKAWQTKQQAWALIAMRALRTLGSQRRHSAATRSTALYKREA